MKKNTDFLSTDTFYHIYNRGINGESIFKQERNYPYFLSKYAFYLDSIVDTYAYCLLNNHFHLLIKTKSESEIRDYCNTKYKGKTIDSIPHFISSQFAHLFNSYTQSINKAVNRTGALFESPFRRIEVGHNSYFTQLIKYIHFNPQKHGLVKDFRDYPHSSYHSHLLTKTTKLKRTEVLSWFGNTNEYQKFHSALNQENKIIDFIIE